MHIQEGINTTLTTCTKMTEEVDRRHGVNGNSSSKADNEDGPQNTTDSAESGGRLKFFKDGKFILELVRGVGREGSHSGWVSVPRKTFWPPAAGPTHTAHLPRAERATSLSVSDDNSSIQSSPWQRDHCWKQNNPRRNISKELTFFYCRSSTLHISIINTGSRLKRRRPFDPTNPNAVNGSKKGLTNGISEKLRNGDVSSPDAKSDIKTEDTVDGARNKVTDDVRWTDYDREKYYHMKLKKPYQYHKLRVYKKTRPYTKPRKLNATIERLRERIASLPAPVNAKLANCRQQEHAMVSPRKRILRELERVSLEEQGLKRRAKPLPGPSRASEPRKEPALTKNASSYSIHSLLSMPEDNPHRSPALHSPEGNELQRRYSPAPHPRYSPTLPFRHPMAPREDSFMYYGPYYPYRSPAPPLWMHYALPPGPWTPPPAPLAHPLLIDHRHLPRDEPSSDVPLNLSKH